MKKIITLFIALALAAGSVSTLAKDKSNKTVATFTVSPKMSCQDCENKIKSNLRFEKGVSKVETDLKSQKITVSYDASKTTPEAISKSFKKIGYTATCTSDSIK